MQHNNIDITQSTEINGTQDNKFSTQKNSKEEIDRNRRKRINRIKIFIVILIILMLIIPTIFCILLGIEVNRLQKQVDQMATIHKVYPTTKSVDTSIAYAAVKNSDFNTIKDNSVTDANTNNGKKDSESESFGTKNDTTSIVKINDESLGNTEQEVKNSGKFAGKKVYLTFDDGPSIYTDEILNILSEYKVKATFFVVGKPDKASKQIYKRIVKEGHTLGMHSYSHDYKYIYKSIQDFDKDFTKLWNLLYDTTGYKPSIYRFPGGSGNLVNDHGMKDFINYLNQSSVVYFDWNVVNGDATSKKYTKKQLVSNVLSGVALRHNSVVLMHDTKKKKTTVESLRELLKELISEGAQLLPLNDKTPPIQMIKADTVH